MVNKKDIIQNLKEKIIYNMNENMNILAEDGQNFLKDVDNNNAVQELIKVLIESNEDNKNSSGGKKITKKKNIRISR